MKPRDLTGEKFGRLTVIELDRRKAKNPKGYRYYWKCKCECGKETIVCGEMLTEGRTKSCGCYRRENTIKMRTTHNKADTRLYNVWMSIKGRCNCKTSTSYKWYGARGITICDEWLDYENFYIWAISSGYDETAARGKCTIDRIDVNGNYTPDNCRWVNQKEQTRNTRRTLKFTIDNVEKSLIEWCEIYNIPYDRAIQRIKAGWSITDALTKEKGARVYG